MTGIDGKAIVITGASSGIGRAAALLLAARGAKVVLGARGGDELEAVAREVQDSGGEAACRRTDVSKRQDLVALVGLALDRHGKLDVLISNAGIGPISKLEELRVEDWEAMVDVNVKGMLYGIAAALPVFRHQGFGHFVNTISTAGIQMSPTMAVYAATKNSTARIAGGARASEVLSASDPLTLAAVTGSVGSVGMAGLTLGGGYGPLIGRFGLAVDNLLAAEVVLADGRIVTAMPGREDELFWALRGGGGNFGVVTDMHVQLHRVPSVRSGMLIYPFAEAKTVLERYADIATSAPDGLTAQVGCVAGPGDVPVVFVAPTWCGPPEEGEAQVAPFPKLGTLLAGSVETTSYAESLTAFDPFIVNGQLVIMQTCWIPALDSANIDVLIHAMENAASPGCAIFTHEFKGAASRVRPEATAFGLRRDHVLVEILATWPDRGDDLEQQRHRKWARETLRAFDALALPGGYSNLLGRSEPDRALKSYGDNAERLVRAKHRYDPDNVFRSAIPLPAGENSRLFPRSVAQADAAKSV